MAKAIKWAYVYGSLEAEVFDTLDNAANRAFGASEYGSESLLYIEHDGDTYDMAWVDKWEQRRLEAMPPAPPARPLTQRMEAQSPEGEWVVYGSYHSVAEAQRDYYELVEAVGEGRVRLVTVGGGES